MQLSTLPQPSRPIPLAGFEHIFRYNDPQQGKVMVKILPGEFYISNSSNEVVVTVLGSCISVCVRDAKACIGGMNHFMLPGTPAQLSRSSSRAVTDNSYGVFAMENLITGILKNGGSRQRLEIKVTGGGRIGSGSGTVGDSNIKFIQRFLAIEGLRPVVVDLGGSQPRKVQYDALTGALRVKRLAPLHTSDVLAQEVQYREAISKTPATGSIELF